MTFVSKKTVNRIEEINREGVLSLEELDTLLLDDQCFDTTLKLLSRRIDPAVAILPSSWGSKGTRGASIDKDTEEPLEIEPGGKTEPVIDPGQGRRILQEPLSRFDEYALAKRLEFHRSRLHHFLGNFHRTDNTPLYEPGRGGSPARISLTWIVGVLGTNQRVMPIDKLTARSLWNNYNNCRSGWVEKNLPKVTVMVRSYRSYGISTDDLSQEGFAALIRAVEKYDWRKKVRFWTYAVFWVRQAVERYICFNKVTIRIPNYLQQKVRRLKRKGRFRHDMDEDMVREMSSEF
ncbi:MAG: hypothetical protein KJ645_03120, partial [Planctomycetes bacterium]|nr:hypothetical protein [Planctomycetota bacterium]